MKSKNWFERHKKDIYVKKAKEEGYLSRAAFKLIEIERKYKIISSSEKILSLENQRLLVDTGDPKVDAELSGYIKVQVEARKTMIVKVEPA